MLVIQAEKPIGYIAVSDVGLSMSINFAAIFLAALGLMGPVVGALIHNAGSVLVVANSSTLIRHRGDK